MKKTAFKFPMQIYERVIGILYIPFHVYLIPSAFWFLFAFINKDIDIATQNLICYAFSALFLLLAMNHYWRATIRDLKGAIIRSLQAIILGYVMYFAANYLIAIIMSLFTIDLVNPNSAAVTDTIALNSDKMVVVMVLLAPIVEETMFRGALFGTIRQKSRVLAYIISALLFSIYHLWSYMAVDGVGVLIYTLQYIPASLALAWCYEWSGTLVAPVIMHAIINLIGAIEIIWR